MSEIVSNKSGLESIKTLLEQILAPFPAESLVQYKSISKLWYDLICSPEFVGMQRRCSRDRGNMVYIICPYPSFWNGFRDMYLMDREGEIINKIIIPGLDDRFLPNLISSFDGLLCFTSKFEGNQIDICICNPVLQKAFMLPRGSLSIIPPIVGVGFDPDNSGHYKVFRFFKDISEPEPEGEVYNCEVYSSATGSWKGIAGNEYRPIHSYSYQANTGHICIGGRVYWFSMSKEDPRIPTGILSVDMKDEKFKEISLPKNVKVVDSSLLLYLIDLDGRLSLVAADNFIGLEPNNVIYSGVYIWVLEDVEQSSWSYKVTTVLDVDHLLFLDSVVAIENEILFVVTDIDMEPHIHVYDLETDDWKFVDAPSTSGHSSWDCPVALPFAGSLSPCRGSNL